MGGRLWAVLGVLFSALSLADAGKPAQRILALSPHAVELLYTIGAGSRIVGTVEYADYPESAKAIPRIGSYHGIQIEQVLALKPDLVVAWRSGNKAADLAKLESLRLRIFYTLPKNIGQIGDELTALGELTGQEKEAKAAVEALNTRYQALKDQYSNRESVSVFYQLWHDPLRTVGQGSWIDGMITDCGGHNLFHEAESDYPMVALDAVIVKNPQVIVIPHHSGEVGAKAELWKKWPEIDAVRLKQIHILNGDLLHRYSVRALDGLQQLCEVIDSARK